LLKFKLAIETSLPGKYERERKSSSLLPAPVFVHAPEADGNIVAIALVAIINIAPASNATILFLMLFLLFLVYANIIAIVNKQLISKLMQQ
jgi:hypothetical protein